ncbi:MAG: hypothetical protein ACE5JK_04710 [Candidatus Omnitrophota bacterium]
MLLNFKGNFQAAIFSRNIIFFTEKEIDPFIYYNNRLIEVTGKIEYIDGPKIIIDHPSQISEIKK